MKHISVFGFFAVLCVSSAAFAYVPSPQNGAFELKFGPYDPNVDEEPGVGSPYEDIFGTDNMLLTTIELDWQFLHKWGFSFGVGASIGFMQASAPETDATGAESSEYTVLNVMPFALLGVIRFDLLADELGVPLVPYIKGGMNWYLWWIYSQGELAEDSESGTSGVGGTPGWQVNPGIMFRLDVLDEMSARTFDNEIGVNHSYIFFELLVAGVDGYGDDHENMFLSPRNMLNRTTFAIGLALEF